MVSLFGEMKQCKAWLEFIPGKLTGTMQNFANGFPSMSNAILCAKASMLLQEHRSEWEDSGIDVYSAVSVKAGPCTLPVSRVGCLGGQVILPLAHTIENEEFMEVIMLENMTQYRDDVIMPSDIFLLQVCSGVDENAFGTCAELVFAPIDASFSDDAPLLPSGFRIIPLDSKVDASDPNHMLDLASTLEVGPAINRPPGEHPGHHGIAKSVVTIAFQFAFEIHLQESIAAMARQYVRCIISSVQRLAIALSPYCLGSNASLRIPHGTPEAQTLARWICQSYRYHWLSLYIFLSSVLSL